MTDKDALYWTLRRENDEFLKRQHWWWVHWLRGDLASQRQVALKKLSDEAEESMRDHIRAQFGYRVNLTTHKCPFDLWVEDSAGRAARIEVKISLIGENKNRSRYQAHIHNSPADVDLVLFIARSTDQTVSGRDWTYVIPIAEIGRRRNISLWSACPGDYRGQWARYLDAWEHLHQAIANSQARLWQLRLIHQPTTNQKSVPPPPEGRPRRVS